MQTIIGLYIVSTNIPIVHRVRQWSPRPLVYSIHSELGIWIGSTPKLVAKPTGQRLRELKKKTWHHVEGVSHSLCPSLEAA